MDPENQDRIREAVERHNREDLVVVLGATDPGSLEVAAQTVTEGDPSYVGPLAGVQLGLPVLHILDEEVKRQIDPDVYRREIGLIEFALDTDAVREVMQRFKT